MATKSRYAGYAKAVQSIRQKPTGATGREQKKNSSSGMSSQISILEKLKSLKNQEFVLTVPMGGADGD